jgi:glycosyltransferase involved in cell wall biosynthesis
MDMKGIVPLLITYNELPNIARTLAGLTWAERIVVVDSGSTDGTLEILASDARIQVAFRPFDTFADQCNYGLSLIGETAKWVLYLDADQIVTPEFIKEVEALHEAEEVAAYEAGFIYCVFGRPIRGSLYPPRPLLFRLGAGHFINKGHGHWIKVNGIVKSVRSKVLHDDRKKLGRWLKEQDGYMEIEKTKLLAAHWLDLDWADRARRMLFVAPWLFPIVYLVGRGGLLSGLPGLYYAIQRSLAEMILSLKLIEARLSKEGKIR